MDATTSRKETRPAAPAFGAARRWHELSAPAAREELFDARARESAPVFDNNIENYIGTVRIPVGIAGPLRVVGEDGVTDYRVPLATTEAALVASYNRGARLLTAAGGCNALVVEEGVSRTPMFAFDSVVDATAFADFVASISEHMHETVATITRHGRLKDVGTVIEGNHVYVDLEFTTGDASGQNMVTFASEAICRQLVDDSPADVRHWFLEANLSGDKKATARSLASVRGKRVVADVVLPRTLVQKALHTTPDRMVRYWYGGALGGVMSGTTGVQGHFANGLAALYLACGQDVACVAESATGITRMETTREGALYTSITLPNVMVGTVGGGTSLPAANACLDILGLSGPGNARKLAEICAGLVLAGELSIIGAFCSGDFAAAHRCLSKGKVFQRRSNDE